MSKPIFYYHPFSGPCRTVSTVAKILNVDMEMKKLDLLTKEHLNPEFLKVNPFHKVPTFVDSDGFVVDESRVIAMYLVESRKPDSFLYPKNDLKKRIQIDRWLHYDINLSTTISAPMYCVFRGHQVQDYQVEQGKETLKTLDGVMQSFEGKFLTGADQFTLADIAMYFSLNTMEVYPKYFKFDDYPNLKSWYHRVAEALKQYDTEGTIPKAIETMKQFIQQRAAEAEKH
ncbi:Glutathione S-transferase [Dermatophagoides pteronyssinus]|uniref:Glutathione S-transferase n=1 Tax=Dermatophagoides pteronyssinus TaxID=6956 RepID=A0ABQ8IUS8_DERPT|nr:Glutathione S-transferase [Dermatophagoides pteronyssinus]